MTSHFDPYLQGKRPELVIAENEKFMAILEEKPLAHGHCVVFPKRVEDAIFDLNDSELAGLLPFAKSIAQAIQKIVPCQKIGIAALGLQVRHAHLHLVPINSADDLNFTRKKLELKQDELKVMANRIKSLL